MKTALPLLLIFLTNFSWSQSPHQIADTDTTLDYKTRFYKDGVLNLNGYYVYAIDSASYFSSDTARRYYDFKTADYNLDSSKMYRLPHGRWMDQYTWKKKKHFSLGEYSGGYLIRKKYDFREDGSLYSTFKRYPKIKGSKFNGSQIVYYDKKDQHITRIEYILFTEDETNLSFWYTLSYSSEGTLTYYSYLDDKTGSHHFIEYTKKGEMKNEYVRNALEWYDKKWNARRTKMTVVTRGKGAKTTEVYRKEKLIRKKTVNY